MNQIVEAFASGFTGIVDPITTAIKTGFTNLIWQDPTAAERVLSDPAQVGLVLGGVGVCVGLVLGVFAFIKHLRG